ncbi:MULTISPECIES: hypothetical protein [Cyanophyceae]|uniref:hypothetical protein n=1 Tax=Cyanophyceae TaxID=3028117 RepID=UPI00016DCCE8|nr:MULTISPECIES: hypothetical protein [Cyanophyceae]ACB01028.1 hypothetical protein SYNPCC7002_F0097 [Picosynechococcus sp. PCC 7002]SMH58694.1 hypothetical protein SAMN06272755_3252 [Picosynechococcus sp. OG1]SMQ86385.1 hypothetical protein SAMN06272774_3126 [Synechococcus sp. 7002]
MDIQQSSDQQSARDITNSSVEATQLTLSALDQFLQKLLQLGMKDDQEITIRVGSKKIYDGAVDGNGKRSKLTPKETKTLREAFSPQKNSGSVRILDKKNTLLFKSKEGQIAKNLLSHFQAETITPKTPDPDAIVSPSSETMSTATAEPESASPVSQEQLDDLQNQLHVTNEKLHELQARLDNLVKSRPFNPTPVHTPNQRVGDWFNQQRNMVADKLRGLANQFSVTASQKFKQTHNQVKQQIHQTLSHTGQQAATVFMQNFVEPAVKVVVSQMEKIGEVEVAQDGTKTFQTNAISWQITPDGGVNLTRKADNQKITPTSATPKDMNILQSFVQQAHECYGQTQKLLPQSASVENHPPSHRSQIQKA